MTTITTTQPTTDRRLRTESYAEIVERVKRERTIPDPLPCPECQGETADAQPPLPPF